MEKKRPKLLEENLYNIRFGNAFLDMTPEAQATNRKPVTYQN